VVAWDNGQWDHWLIAKGPVTMAHYTRSDIPYYYALAEAYTICDNYHCSTFGPTVPNRLYTISGMIDPHSTGGGPVLDNVWPTNGLTWTTYPERLQNSGISWHIYQGPYGANFNLLSPTTFFHNFMTAQPGNPLYDHSMADTLDSITAFQQDATNGRLPRVSWIVLPWGRCEHPPSAPTTGSFFLKRIIDTLAVDPRVLNSTALFLTYDENGGYFDHVPSPVPRSGTQDEFVTGVPIGLGVRVPMIIVSPWTRGGHVCSQLFDHTSILQFLEKWTGVREPNISAWRRQVCGDLTSAFDFQHPDFTVPVLPVPAVVICTNANSPVLPPVPSMPQQEAGVLSARPLPYEPNVSALLDCSSGVAWFSFTNGGSASVHLDVHANQFQNVTPRPYDVPASGVVVDFIAVTNAAGAYDFTCYGPRGFNRRFAGTLSASCGVEASPVLDADAGCIAIQLQNSTSHSVTLLVSNALDSSLSIHVLTAGTGASQSIGIITNGCLYDVSITASHDMTYLRHFAGHMEIGLPALDLEVAGSALTLSYPAWASDFLLESTTNLGTGLWTSVGVLPTRVGSRLVTNLTWNPQATFFRLRKP